MAPLEKFLFTVSFDEADLARAEAEAKAAEGEDMTEEIEEEAAPTFSEEELESARQQSFAEGKEAGIREASDAVESRISDALGSLTSQFQELFNQHKIATTEIFDDAANIALAITRKCFPHLSETESQRTIEDMVRNVLAEIREEPRVMVHVHPDLVDPLNESIEGIANNANFEGQVLIIDDEAIAAGDCQVTWSSGSAERDMGAIWQRVDEIVEQNLSTVRNDVVEEVVESGEEIVSDEAPQPAEAAPPAAAAETPPPPPLEEAPPAEPVLPEPETMATSDGMDENMMALNDIAPMDDLVEEAPAEPLADAPPPETHVSAANEVDPTAAHLQAGPGIVEETEDEGILEADQPDENAETEAGVETSDEATESTPPMGPNFSGT
jgi:flagellar assembly protein FliH